MKKIMIFILAAIIGFSSVMTPFYSKAAMASDIALDAELSELFYTIMVNAMVAAGFMEADDMEYDDAMSCFESFCDAVVPVGTRTDSAGYAVDSSGNRLILLQNSAGASIDLSNIITEGTSALKPAKEQWEKFKVIQGGSVAVIIIRLVMETLTPPFWVRRFLKLQEHGCCQIRIICP